MDNCEFKVRARATGPDLCLVLRHNGQEFFNQVLTEEFQEIAYEFDNSEAQHILEFEMRGKLAEHTEIDEQGNILADRVIELRDFTMDGIDMGYDFLNLLDYRHSFNGNQEVESHKFFGDMGCNGVAVLRFTTPIYLWILEHS